MQSGRVGSGLQPPRLGPAWAPGWAWSGSPIHILGQTGHIPPTTLPESAGSQCPGSLSDALLPTPALLPPTRLSAEGPDPR